MARSLPRRRSTGLAVLLVAFSLLVQVAPAAARIDPAIARRFLTAERPGLAAALQRVVDTTRLEFGMPGVSVAVRFPDGTTWTGVSGYADIARSVLVRPDTPFALASVSKPFVAGVVMGLVEDRQLYLGDSVARLLPDVKPGGRAIDPRITVRQLLDHTSGLRDYLTSNALDKEVLAAPTTRWSVARALRYVGKPLAVPGTRFSYSNTNYLLLGLIVERLTGASIAQGIHDRWIDPLRLTSAVYQGVDRPAMAPAVAYRFGSSLATALPIDVTDGTDVRPFTAITTAAGPAGSMMASAPDTARFLEALVTAKSLRPETVARMVDDARRTTAIDPRFPYGLGLQRYSIGGRESIGHSGRLLGARAVARYFPASGVTIVVLTNQSRTDPAVVLTRLLDILLPMRDVPGLAAS